MDELDQRLMRLKRATVGRNALSIIAVICLLASGAFWGVLHWSLLMVPGAGVPQLIIVVVMSIVYMLVLPLLLSMLAPTTPAGMALQKTQWRTFGFVVIIGSTGVLVWHARNMLYLWWLAQPNVAGSELAMFYTLSCLIAFVVVPALSWVQVTPEQWLSQIQQAHDVKKLEIMQAADLAIVKARLQWATARAAVSYYNLLPQEQQEVRETLRGLMLGICDQQRAIVASLQAGGMIERSMQTMGDAEIADAFDYVAQQIDKPVRGIAGALTPAAPPVPDESPADALSYIADSLPRPSPSPRPAPPRPTESAAPPRGAAIRGDTRRYAAEYESARGKLPGTWSARQLAEALDKSERAARDRIVAWEGAGLVGRDNDGRGSFYFTEGE